MTDQPNPNRKHRIRVRQAAARDLTWEFFEVLLAFAYTVQQETTQPKPTRSDPLADGVHPAFGRIAACAQNLADATGAAIALGNADGMVCVARSGVSAPSVGAAFDGSEGLSGECIRTGQSAICVNAAADPRVNYQACRALNIASLLYLPLRSAEGSLIGMLGVFSPGPRHFSQRDISCLRFTETLVREALASSDHVTLEVFMREAGFAGQQIELAEPEPAPALPPVVESLPTDLSAIFSAPLKRHELDPQPTSSFDDILDERPAKTEADADDLPKSDSDDDTRGHSRIPAVLSLSLVALLAFVAWQYHRTHSAQAQAAPRHVPVPTSVATAVRAPAPSAERALTPQVSLRSSVDNAEVTALLTRAIRFEGYQLDHPDRIYFDLHGIRLTDDKGDEFKNSDGLISGIRLAAYAAGVTRIVFDLRGQASYDARLADNPQRLIIQLRSTGDAPNGGVHRLPDAP